MVALVNTAMEIRILKMEGISLKTEELLVSQVEMHLVEIVN
jgi:hypothetical protein